MGPWLSGAPPSPQPPSTQFLQPLGVGTVLSRVLEPPLFRTRRERVLWTPWGGGWGVGPWFLGIHFKVPERLCPWIRPWGGRKTQEFTGGKRGSGNSPGTLRLTLPPLGPGLGSGSPGLSRARSLGNSRG